MDGNFFVDLPFDASPNGHNLTIYDPSTLEEIKKPVDYSRGSLIDAVAMSPCLCPQGYKN